MRGRQTDTNKGENEREREIGMVRIVEDISEAFVMGGAGTLTVAQREKIKYEWGDKIEREGERKRERKLGVVRIRGRDK